MTDKIDKSITPERLKATLEQQYYQNCVQFRTQRTDEQIDKALAVMISSITKIEASYAILQMFEHCVVCRDMNQELALNLDLTISI